MHFYFFNNCLFYIHSLIFPSLSLHHKLYGFHFFRVSNGGVVRLQQDGTSVHVRVCACVRVGTGV